MEVERESWATEGSVELKAATEKGPPPTRQQRGTNFSDDELVRLCRAWLNVNQNSRKGTSQKSFNFWCHVEDVFVKARVPTVSCTQGSP